MAQTLSQFRTEKVGPTPRDRKLSFRRSVLILAIVGSVSFLLARILGGVVLGLGFSAGDPDIFENDGVIECNLGDVTQGGTISRIVPIRNREKSPVTIATVSKSCNCLAADFDRIVIDPGENAKLTVTLTNPMRIGRFRHELQIKFGEDRPPTVVRFFGVVGSWIQEESPQISFGDVCPGDSKELLVPFHVAEEWPPEQRRIECNLPFTSIKKVSSDEAARQIECMLVFEPTAGADLKEVHGDLILRWVGNEERTLVLPCRAKIVSEWVSSPSEIALAELNPGKASEFKLRIQTRKPRISFLTKCRVTAEPPDYAELSTTSNGDGWTVTGLISPKERFGVNRVMINVTSQDGKVVFSVPVYWEVQKKRQNQSN